MANGRSMSTIATPVTSGAGAASSAPKGTYDAADLHGLLKTHDLNDVHVHTMYRSTWRAISR